MCVCVCVFVCIKIYIYVYIYIFVPTECIFSMECEYLQVYQHNSPFIMYSVFDF